MKLLPRTFFGKSFFRVSPSGKTYIKVIFDESFPIKLSFWCLNSGFTLLIVFNIKI